MERLSIFNIYKIGVGPSSSHTLGPWKAANQFALNLGDKPLQSIQIQLFGSLSKTGVGHGTDIAVQLGLQGFNPETIATEKIGEYIQSIKTEEKMVVNGQAIAFRPSRDIIFEDYALIFHPNALSFTAVFADGSQLKETYFSLGGGFILKEEDQTFEQIKLIDLPYPIDCEKDLLAHIEKTGWNISEIVYQNELCFNAEPFIHDRVAQIWRTMIECAHRGCYTSGILPGGLNVKRRAQQLNASLLQNDNYLSVEEWLDAIKKTPHNFANVNKWVSCFALAVNEENAALGRIVTSPTNGAAGVIPAVLMYYYCFGGYRGEEDIVKFMLVSGEIGSLFKKGATISAAQGGCQAEIGVSSAMAAAGLTELLGGNAKQVLMAAEIAMEHHLGLTCDPVGGLVQVPCIERNTMGAIKAITAAHLALSGDPQTAVVSLDTVIKTMWETAKDMHDKYKETAEGGLAMNIPVVLPNC